MKTWKAMGALLASRTGEATSVTTEHLLQSLSVALQRENARMVLRRLPAEDRPAEPLADP
jgi:hypothetical protein